MQESRVFFLQDGKESTAWQYRVYGAPEILPQEGGIFAGSRKKARAGKESTA